MKLLGISAAFTAFSAVLLGQGSLDPAKLLKPPTDTWATYSGDYTGQRFSPLKTVNSSNVKNLSLAWVYRANAGSTPGGATIKGTPLELNGVLYVTIPDHVWAIDARSGREIWHHVHQSKGGIHIGNRGVGIYANWLYFETPDCQLVSLNLKDGKERWHKTICDLDQMYYASVAPIVVKNHILVGVSGDDLDIPGYFESRDPETGELQWHWSVSPKKGEPGFETWPNEEAASHGGGMTWGTTTYDPELNQIYLGTGNPQPVVAGKARPGDNLYTGSIVALNPDTGKLVWYFQPSPHDTHDWDNVEVPVLYDGNMGGQNMKLLSMACRNGWFFTLDRKTGKALVSKEYVHTNWTKGIDAKGQPIPDPRKEPQFDGSLVSPNQGGASNWPPPTFSPDTGLFYVNAARAYSVWYLYDTDDKPEGWAGTDRGGWAEALLQAIDYKTGQIRWSHKWEGTGGRSGLLSTAGNLLFAGDTSGNFVALNPVTGDPLWHANLGSSVSNAPMTYELEGTQYVIVSAGDTLYGFRNN